MELQNSIDLSVNIHNYKAYAKERDEALLSLDRERILAYCKKQRVPIPKDEEVFWGGVCKSICQMPNAPAEKVAQAKLWLHAHGMNEKVVL